MKLITLLFCAYETLAQACASIATRPEIRSLSTQQQTKFFNAVKGLRNLNGADFFSSSSGTHYGSVNAAHGVPAFMPWHREFIRRYEKALQAVDATVVLPYWDWTLDYSAPQNSPVLSSSMMGGNGRSSDYCVVNGAFSGWNVTIPNAHCLKRQYNSGSGTGAFTSPSTMESILRTSTSYDSLRQSIEGTPHGTVHNGIGGNNGDFSQMYSPNDPLFYMHHAFIDLLWNEWQMRNPSLANTYNGKVNNAPVSSSDNMVPFNVPVSKVFSTSSPGYCYTYPRYSGPVPKKGILFRRQDSSGSYLDNYETYVLGLEQLASGLLAPLGFFTSPIPDSLPSEYIAMNNLNEQNIRRQETLIKRFLAVINLLL